MAENTKPRAPKVTIVSDEASKQGTKPKAADAKPTTSAKSKASTTKPKAPAARVEGQPSAPKAPVVQEEASAPKPAPEPAPKPKAPKVAVAQEESEPEPAAPVADVPVARKKVTQSIADTRTGVSNFASAVAPGHSHALLFGCAGLLVALLIFIIGFLRTLLIVVLVLLGVAIGQIYDGDPKIINAVKGLFTLRREEDDL